MAQVVAYSSPFFPYQASPIVLAMTMGAVPARSGALLCAAVALATLLVLLPLQALWFTALGWIP